MSIVFRGLHASGHWHTVIPMLVPHHLPPTLTHKTWNAVQLWERTRAGLVVGTCVTYELMCRLVPLYQSCRSLPAGNNSYTLQRRITCVADPFPSESEFFKKLQETQPTESELESLFSGITLTPRQARELLQCRFAADRQAIIAAAFSLTVDKLRTSQDLSDLK